MAEKAIESIRESISTEPNPSAQSCENCQTEEANGYCNQCQKFIGPNCIEVHKKWAMFASHEIYNVLNDAQEVSVSPVAHQPIQSSVPLTRDQALADVEKSLSVVALTQETLKQSEAGLVEQETAALRELDSCFQKLLDTKQQFKELIQTGIAVKKEKIASQKKAAEAAMIGLRDVKQSICKELTSGVDDYMVSSTLERAKIVCSEANSIRPIDEGQVFFLPGSSFDDVGKLGKVINLVRVRGKGLKTAMAGHTASFDLHITEVTGTPLSPNLLSCQLIPTIDSPVIQCDVCQVTDDQFEVTYCSPNVGLHQLLVKVGGAEIPGSPFTVNVLPSPEMRRSPIRTLTGLYYPHSIAVTKEGNLVITEVDPKTFGKGKVRFGDTSHIIILDPVSGVEIRRIGKWGTGEQEFRNPFGVAVTQDGHIVVIDSNNYRVKLLTGEGKVISSVGSSGSKPLQFFVPLAVAVHPNGQIFISDSYNYRVQVLNTDLTFSHCFGSKGTGVGQFSKPSGIAIDSQGMVYVVDQVGCHVKKFTPEGTFVAVIGGRGVAEGQFKSPAGVCIDANDVIYVTDFASKTVTMFSTEGAFLGHVGNSDGSSFSVPRRVAVDTSGRLYITQSNSVVVY